VIPTASTCNEQAEGDKSGVVFLLQDGAMLPNVIIGPSNGEGESKSLTSLKYRINTLMNCKCALSALARSTTSGGSMSEDALLSSRRLARRMSTAAEPGMRMIRCFSVMVVELLLFRPFL